MQKRKRLIIIGHDNLKAPLETPFPHINWNNCISQEKTTLRHILENTLDGAMVFPKRNIPNDINKNTWIVTDLVEPPPNNIVHPYLTRLVNGIRNKSSKEVLLDQNSVGTIINPNGLISFGRRISSYHGEIVDPDQPCKTIICSYGMCPRLFVGLHNPTTDVYWVRTLTITELAQIQAFPKNYQFQGNIKELITQIGNAVPSNIVCSIAKQLPNIVFKSHQQEYDVKKGDISDTE
jgi:site-specific DNA-cytosine methylase